METKYFEGEMSKVTPIVNQEGSDSAMLDNTLEFLMMSGLELPLAVMILIPEPWINNQRLPFFSQTEISWERCLTGTVFAHHVTI